MPESSVADVSGRDRWSGRRSVPILIGGRISSGRAIGHILSVFGEGDAGESSRSIRREGVRIEKDPGLFTVGLAV